MLLRSEDKAKSNDDGDIGPRGHVKHERVINVGPRQRKSPVFLHYYRMGGR